MKIKDNSVNWQVLDGDEEKAELKNIIEAQQESYNRSKNRGKCHFIFYTSKLFVRHDVVLM